MLKNNTQKVNSHIQLPKCSLKSFTDSKNNIYYYDFKTNEVKRSTPKNFNAEYGYYYPEIEEYLNKIETPFSKIITFIKETDFGQETIIRPDNFNNTVMDYLYALMGRSNVVLKTMMDNSFSLQLLTLEYNRNFATYIGIETARKSRFYNNYLISFIKNNSGIPFVLPCEGVYNFILDDKEYINMPITPTMSIVIIPKEISEKYMENNKIKMIEISSDEVMEIPNLRAFLTEMQGNKRGVVATSREQLKKIANELNY